jgi:hypothetical protein
LLLPLYEYKSEWARVEAQFVPIGMPTTCWNSVPPKETNMLSMRKKKPYFLFICFLFIYIYTWYIHYMDSQCIDQCRMCIAPFFIKFLWLRLNSKFVVLGYKSTYFSNKIHKGKTCYSEEQMISMLEFLIDNIFVSFGGTLFQQVVGIPMGTNCAPLLADLPSYSYESEFLQKLAGCKFVMR